MESSKVGFITEVEPPSLPPPAAADEPAVDLTPSTASKTRVTRLALQ